MSDFQGLLLLLAVVATGYFVFVYQVGKLFELSHVIATGTVEGVRVSTEYRWACLMNGWVGQFSGFLIVFFLFAGLDLLFTRATANEGFRFFAYLHAAFVSLAGVNAAVFGAFHFRHLRLAIRQAEAD